MSIGPQGLTADEALQARAAANGYQTGAFKEADKVRNGEKHVTKTKKDEDATLRRYVLYDPEIERTLSYVQIRLIPGHR